jgi:WD40 repeat protein
MGRLLGCLLRVYPRTATLTLEAKSDVTAMTALPEKGEFLVGCKDGSLVLWGSEYGEHRILEPRHHRHAISSICVMRGKRAAAISKDGVVSVWDVQGRRLIKGLTFDVEMGLSRYELCELTDDARLVALCTVFRVGPIDGGGDDGDDDNDDNFVL